MEILTIKEVLPLTTKLTGKEDDTKLTYQIKEAILDEVNSRLGINANAVLKLLLNGLKMPKDKEVDVVDYVRKATVYVIEKRRYQISKPIGKFVDMTSYYNDFRDNGYEDMTHLNKKYFELLCYHIAYENPFLTKEQLVNIHRSCLNKNKTFENYLLNFEKELDKLNVPVPKEQLIDKAKKKLEVWEKILKDLDD